MHPSGSREKPLVVDESPKKKLTPSKHFRTAKNLPLERLPRKIFKPDPDTSLPACRRFEGIHFELYSHATDPDRSLQSVLSVAGAPLCKLDRKDIQQINRTTPEASTGITTSEASTDRTTPKASTDRTTPKASTDRTTPKASTDRTTSEASTGRTTPEASTDRTTPEASTDRTTPKASTDRTTPEASTDRTTPKASTDRTTPKASTDRTTPKASTDRTTEIISNMTYVLNARSVPVDPTHRDVVTDKLAMVGLPTPLCSDIINVQPFDKFSQGTLEALSESRSNVAYNLVSYLQLSEHLLSHGMFVPASRVSEVITLVLGVKEKWALNKFHSILNQDLTLRVDTALPLSCDYLRDTLRTLTRTLAHTPSHLPSQIVLHYVVGLLIKNPMTSCIRKCVSRVRSEVLDVAFSVQDVTCLPSLRQTLLTLVSLPLLSSDNDLNDITRELSVRIDKMSSTEEKCDLFRSLIVLKLRYKVLDFHLEQFFVSHFDDSGPVTTLKDISIQHLRRLPYRPNGDPHDVCFFLRLLCLMIECHLSLNPSDCVDDLRPGVTILSGHLYDDPLCVTQLSNPQVWMSMQILTALTN